MNFSRFQGHAHEDEYGFCLECHEKEHYTRLVRGLCPECRQNKKDDEDEDESE